MEYIGNKKKQGSIVELLRDEILAGNILDGSEMTQNELAESLGVSRMPVREAPCGHRCSVRSRFWYL